MTDPTPKLTADTPEARAKHVMAWPCIDERTRKMHHLAIMAEIESAEAIATRNAFEKAAKLRPPQPRLAEPENMHDYLEGWVDAVAAYTAAIRALAKEQADDL